MLILFESTTLILLQSKLRLMYDGLSYADVRNLHRRTLRLLCALAPVPYTINRYVLTGKDPCLDQGILVLVRTFLWIIYYHSRAVA